MPKLDRAGVKIHYEVHGKGPTILLSHGYSSTSRMWDDQVAALKDRYRVIVWDFRGHGETDYPADASQYSEALTVGDMLALLDLAGANKAIVAGLSLGGYMSLAFHASHPERVRALMLVQINQLCGLAHAADRGFRHGIALANQCDNRTVVVGIHLAVQQVYAGQFHGLHNSINSGLVAAF